MSLSSSSSVLQEFKTKEIKCIKGAKGELGTGGFGTVRLSFHRVLGPVAVKCFSVTGGIPEKKLIIKEIRNELELLQKSNHAHILRVHGWSQWSGSMALILEYLPGGNLKNFLRNPNSRIRTILRLRICVELADAIAFIHNLTKEQRLTHGDIKPENILLSADLHCKLADFGGAKLSSHTGKAGKQESSSEEKYELTPIYAAPERLGDEPVKPKKEQDTYSYGLIVHMVLTREPPHVHYPNVAKYLQAVVKGKRPRTEPIEELKLSYKIPYKRQVIETLENVMRKCWEHVPSLRPNMLDVRDELHNLLRQAAHAEVLQTVTDAVASIKINVPSPDDHHCVPLDFFDTQTRKFVIPADHHALEQRDSNKEAKKAKLPLSQVFDNDDSSRASDKPKPLLDILLQYKLSLRTGNLAESKTQTAQFISFMESRVETSTEELRALAAKLRHEKRFLESVALYDAAAYFCRRKTVPKECVTWMAACMDGMKETAIAMVKNDPDLRAIVPGHVILRMRDVLRQIEDVDGVADQIKCLQVVWVLQSIEFCQYLSDLWEEREATLAAALAKMRNVLGDASMRYSIYGTLLHNMGNVHKRMLRWDKAAACYLQAIDTFQTAGDYENENERKEDLKRSEANLYGVYQSGGKAW